MDSELKTNKVPIATWPGLLCIVVICVGLVPSVFAQWVGSIADPSLPLFPAKLVESMPSRLGLSDVQQKEIDAVCARFRIEHERLYELSLKLSAEDWELGQEVLKRKKSRQPKIDSITVRRTEIFRQQLALGERIVVLKNHALVALKATLRADQVEEWERLLRDRRRQSTLGRDTVFIGEGVDLLRCLDEAEIAGSELVLIRNRYADDLNPLLMKRNRIRVEELRAAYVQELDGTSNHGDPRIHAIRASIHSIEDLPRADRELAELGDILRRERLEEKRLKFRAALYLRRHNLRYLDEFNQRLTPLDQGRLKKVYQKYAFARYPIFHPLEVDRLLEALLADELLDPAIRAEIERIRVADYLPQRARLNLLLAGAYERWELRWEERILETLDSAYEDRIRRLHEQRKVLQERIVHDVARLLSEEALARHPVPVTIKDEPRF